MDTHLSAFASARLLVHGHPLKMEKTTDGLRLTLSEGNTWDALDTVVVLERVE